MDLQQRIELLEKTGAYILSEGAAWKAVKERASEHNSWFIPEFINLATTRIALDFLQRPALESLASQYAIPDVHPTPRNIGLVMAGNLPLVGFHDFLCSFLSGHRQTIKLSSRDELLLPHLVDTMISMNSKAAEYIRFLPMLKGCDAYIATGSNNSARYFDYYFSKYPHIIRRNRTSVAILQGQETISELEALADDVHLYFGLGCRNVSKIYVPRNYDFLPLLQAFRKYHFLADHHKYMNNYDYQLAVLIINKLYYMTNDSIVLTENKSVFSPISQLNYEFYEDDQRLYPELGANRDIQCIVGKTHTPFGQAQQPCLTDYADGVDTLQFLLAL